MGFNGGETARNSMGLSFTRFAYSELEITPAPIAPDGRVAIALDVLNEGDRAGDEVVQLYVRDPVASVTRPCKQLAGFVRLHLSPGERRRVCFSLDASQLALYDPRTRLVVEPGEVRVMVGASSDDIRSDGSFVIEGDVRELLGTDMVATTVEIV